MQLLIDCGINVNLRNEHGQTAQELALKMPKSFANSEILQKLSEAQPSLLQVRKKVCSDFNGDNVFETEMHFIFYLSHESIVLC